MLSVMFSLLLGFAALSSGPAAGQTQALESTPIVIAHRGASGERPEHTLAAYQLALEQGADFIELDLVATQDGVLIARHENALAMVALDSNGGLVRDALGAPSIREATTDVADRPEFADRLAVKNIDGRDIGGWFSEDFSLAEIKSLNARERMPAIRTTTFDDRLEVPTLTEVIDLIDEWQQQTGQRPGLYIELKHPTYFLYEGHYQTGEQIGVDLGELLLQGLRTGDFMEPDRIFIQSFEIAPLIVLHDRMVEQGLELPLVQLFGDIFNRRFRAQPRDVAYRIGTGDTSIYEGLESLLDGGIRDDISYAELATPAVLAYMAGRYAAAIGPRKDNIMLVRWQAGTPGSTVEYTGKIGALLGDANAQGLDVHPYTLRAEAPFLVVYKGRRLDVTEEALILLEQGVGGFFIDQPALGRTAVERYLSELTE